MPTLTASGVDTISYGYRHNDDAVLDAFMDRPAAIGPGGSLILKQRGACGGRAMAYRAHGLVVYESRLGALLASSDECHDLAPSCQTLRGSEVAREQLAKLLRHEPGRCAEVRRFDLAAEVTFEEPAQGFAFLAALVGVCPPRAKINVYKGVDGHVQTVNVVTQGRGVILQRVYDKGRESGSHEPGHRIRLESQNRPAKSARFGPGTFSTLDLAPTYGRTMQHHLNAEELVAAGPDGATDHLVGMATRGELSVARASRLAGDIAFLKYAGRAAFHDPDQPAKINNNRSARRLKALRDAGVTLDEELPSDAVIPVSQLLRDAVNSFGLDVPA